jgi:hypothetical protein
MMYLVSYTLNPPRVLPPAFLTALQGAGEWWHYLDSTWIISTTEDINALSRRIIPPLNPEDRILMVQIMPNAATQGWLAKDAWDWINARRYQ